MAPSPKVSFSWPLDGRITLPGLSTPGKMPSVVHWRRFAFLKTLSPEGTQREPQIKRGCKMWVQTGKLPIPPHSALGLPCLQLLRTLVVLSMSALPISMRAVLPAASLGERLWPQPQPCLSLILAGPV